MRRLSCLAAAMSFLPLMMHCDSDKKSRRAASAQIQNTTTPASNSTPSNTDCFETEYQAAITRGEQPNNVTIYEKCNFFAKVFTFRNEYLACRSAGKLWLVSERQCSEHDIDAELCTAESLKQNWSEVYPDEFFAELQKILDDKFKIDHCATVNGAPRIVFIRANEDLAEFEYKRLDGE
jgi:hypothetical protein